MTHNNNKNNALTPKQMEQALCILRDGWCMMNGEEFGKLCLDMEYNDVKRSYINENFRRFQNDLGGQIAKTSGEFMTRLATGLVRFHELNNARQYYVLAIDYDGGGYGVEFGSYDKLDVIEEQKYNNEYYDDIDSLIITTIDDQQTIDEEINKLNNNRKEG